MFVQPEAGEKRSSRLSETEDGETLCRYAKAFWSINGDKEKALFYFEKAVEASPSDRYSYKYEISFYTNSLLKMRSSLSSVCGGSIILGEYARFLWEIEE